MPRYTVIDNEDGTETKIPNFKEGENPSDANDSENWDASTILQYYKERKLCVIGSDTMESPGRAI
jgi:hypothetical protein